MKNAYKTSQCSG